MIDFDQLIADVLEQGRCLAPSDLGGLETVTRDPDGASQSVFAPELVTLVLDHGSMEVPEVGRFITTVVRHVRNDFAINQIVDVLARRPRLPDSIEQECFRAWSMVFDDRSQFTSVRTAALRGAFVLKRENSKRATQLAAKLVSVELDDDPDFLAHVARIAGLLYAEEPIASLMDLLTDLSRIEGVTEDATFELGMSAVGHALSTSDVAEARSYFTTARHWFDTASRGTEPTPKARVLAIAMGVLEDFYDRRRSSDIKSKLDELRLEAFATTAYLHHSAGDFLNGVRATQIAAWSSLGLRLEALDRSLDDEIWLDGTQVIEEELLAIYTASRTILGCDRGGLECIVRPRIQESLQSNRYQLLALQRWLKTNGTSQFGEAALDLIEATEAAFSGGATADPTGAAAVRSTAVAFIEKSALTTDQRDRLLTEVLLAKVRIESYNTSPIMQQALVRIYQEFSQVSEFADDAHTHDIIMAVVYQSLLFLEFRLDTTTGQDPTAAYLFASDEDSNPLEKHLQQDYLRFLKTANLGSADEIRGVGGGRADVMHKHHGVRFVIEIKREKDDASFEALLGHYGDQTAIYQTTNVPLGILLVLDLTTKGGVTDHLKNLYKPVSGDLFRDGVMRGVLIIRVPALRLTPSEATVAASGGKGRIASDFLKTSDLSPDEGSEAQTSSRDETKTTRRKRARK